MLDQLLMEAAAQAGAEVRQGFNVQSLVFSDGAVHGIRGYPKDGASPLNVTARVVVGADGAGSLVAREVGAIKYNVVPALEALYLAYWSNLPTGGEFQVYGRGSRAMAAIPTNDGLTVVLAAWPIEEFVANRHDVQGNYLLAFNAEPAFGERIAGARRESRVVGAAMENFYRRSYGPGWALVGDAGYHKDATTAQGISDAFRDAEALADALDEVLSGRRPFDHALGAYQATRDELTRPMYELTLQLASFEPLSAETVRLLAAVSASRPLTKRFLSAIAGTLPVEEFFAALAQLPEADRLGVAVSP